MTSEQKSWRCFHCDDVFTSEVDARAHFGSGEASEPACCIKVAGEFALLQALRNAEDELSRYRNEDSDVLRAMWSMSSDHAAALRREEEKGYARGLRDAKATEDEARKERLAERVHGRDPVSKCCWRVVSSPDETESKSLFPPTEPWPSSIGEQCQQYWGRVERRCQLTQGHEAPCYFCVPSYAIRTDVTLDPSPVETAREPELEDPQSYIGSVVGGPLPLPDQLRDTVKNLERGKELLSKWGPTPVTDAALLAESPLARAVRIARGNPGPTDQPVHFAGPGAESSSGKAPEKCSQGGCEARAVKYGYCAEHVAKDLL